MPAAAAAAAAAVSQSCHACHLHLTLGAALCSCVPECVKVLGTLRGRPERDVHDVSAVLSVMSSFGKSEKEISRDWSSLQHHECRCCCRCCCYYCYCYCYCCCPFALGYLRHVERAVDLIQRFEVA